MSHKRKDDGKGENQSSPKRPKLPLVSSSVFNLQQALVQVFFETGMAPLVLQHLLGHLEEKGIYIPDAQDTKVQGLSGEEFWATLVLYNHFWGDGKGNVMAVTRKDGKKATDSERVQQLAFLLHATRCQSAEDTRKAVQAAEAEAAKFKLQWENQCRASDIEKAELHERIRGAQTTIQALRNQTVGLEAPSESLEHFETRLRTLEKNHKTELEVLQQKLKETVQERDQSQDNFTAMLEAHQKEIADCEAREAELKKDRDYYFEANKKTQDEYEKALNLTTDAQQLATRLQQEAKEDSKHINDMQAQRDEWMGKAQERGDTVKDLEKQLEVVTEERNHWATKAAHANDRVEHLELKTKKLLDEYEALNALHKGQKEQILDDIQELKDINQKYDALLAEKKAGDEQIKKLKDASLLQYIEKQGQMGDLKARLELQAAEIQQEAEDRKDVEEQLEETTKQYNALLVRFMELEARGVPMEQDFKMDTNIDNLKKGVIAACAHPDLKDGEAYWLCEVTEVVLRGNNKGNFKGLWYRWDDKRGHYTLLKDNHKVMATGGLIDRSWFKGILAKLPTSDEAFKRVRVP